MLGLPRTAGFADLPYTAVLVAGTATPTLHEARRELPFVFASSSFASAGPLTDLLAGTSRAMDGRGVSLAARVGIAGAVAEVASTALMRRRLRVLDVTATDPASVIAQQRGDRAVPPSRPSA